MPRREVTFSRKNPGLVDDPVRGGDRVRELAGHERGPNGLPATEPGTLLASRTVSRSLVTTFLLVAALVVVVFAVGLPRFVLTALLILFARVSLALIHGASLKGS